MKAEIHKKLKDCKSALESLGAERVTREQQAAFILEVAMAFQNIANQALETNYGHEMFDQHPNTRLATVLVGREEKFAETMDKWGHEQNFNDEDEVATEYTLQLDALGNALDCHSGSQSAEGYNGELEPLRTIPNPPELEDALSEHGTVKEPGHIVLEWIEEVYRTSKGFEIGTFNSALLSTLMKRQSMRWEAISLGYISDAIAIVHQFISTALKHICADERVHDSLLDHLMDELTEKYKSTLKHVHFLLAVEMTGNLRTEDPSFNADLNER